MTQSTPQSETERDETSVECPTCEEQVPREYMSGGECLSCEHVRADARQARRDAEREAR